MVYTEENLTKVLVFDEGPVEAIGYKIEMLHCAYGKRPGDIVIFIHGGVTTDLLGLHRSTLKIYVTSVSLDGARAHYIPLDYDIRLERQLRHIVDLLTDQRIITPEQRQRAYDAFGVDDDVLYRALRSRPSERTPQP